MVNMEQTWREVLFDQKRRTLPKGPEPVSHVADRGWHRALGRK